VVVGHVRTHTHSQADGRVTDLNTNRARYSNPYILGDWVGWANQHAKKFVATYGGCDPTEAKILQTIGKLNLEQRTSAFSKFGCKNEGFVTAMVRPPPKPNTKAAFGPFFVRTSATARSMDSYFFKSPFFLCFKVTKNAELHRDGFRLTASGAVFEDGREFACDSVIACTGYRNTFPLLLDPDTLSECVAGACPSGGPITYSSLADELTNPRLLYKQCIHPAFPDG
jgi:hypothetical protein